MTMWVDHPSELIVHVLKTETQLNAELNAIARKYVGMTCRVKRSPVVHQ
jgi:hypothetical protein